MPDFRTSSLSFDPIHGYIAFSSAADASSGEVSERQIIDNPWVQRMRQIHQLQTAWWVFPTAEHTRFQHVLGVMHLASRAVAALYDSLKEVCPDAPSRGYVESLMRLAGLLHDVGHGPFGHFFDEHYLSRFGQTHETVGSTIVDQQLGDLIRRVRRNPNSALEPGESLDPQQISALITRPAGKILTRSVSEAAAPRQQGALAAPPDGSGEPSHAGAAEIPRWLQFLRSLFSGIYTIDNMDFVLRDAYMSGYSARAFDLDRLLRYSFFSPAGLTIHSRGVDALVRFMQVRAELFRTVYFHRTVRAIDLSLRDLFVESRDLLFPGNPLEHLDEYCRFTEWSLLVDVARWADSDDPRKRAIGPRWREFLARRIRWRMVCQRTLVFGPSEAESASIFSQPQFVEAALRKLLPPELRDAPFAVDLARHVHRPHTRGAAAGQNFLFDPVQGQPRPLTDDQLFRHLPISHRICRIYAESDAHAPALAAALDQLLGPGGVDDLTNM